MKTLLLIPNVVAIYNKLLTNDKNVEKEYLHLPYGVGYARLSLNYEYISTSSDLSQCIIAIMQIVILGRHFS